MTPPTSPMQICPAPAFRNAMASSTPPTTMILSAPPASATAAVVKARNTSMMTTVPTAPSAPGNKLSIRMSILGFCADVADVSGIPIGQSHRPQRKGIHDRDLVETVEAAGGAAMTGAHIGAQ